MIYNNNSAAPTLGNIAQSSSRDSFEGEKNYKRVAKRRFALHRLQAEILPDEKGLAACCLHAAPHSWITGNHVPAKGKNQAFFGGLKHCDSSSCVLCASRRAEETRKELTVLLAECQRRGLFVYHLTFTLSHNMSHSLQWELDTMRGALEKIFAGRWWEAYMLDTGYVGRVRAFENPHGENGWHLHAHILYIHDKPQIPERMEAEIYQRYKAMLGKFGATASPEHGLKVAVGYSELADYVSKFGHDPILDQSGLENEIADFRTKKGKKGSLTPFELLAAAYGENEPLQKLTEAYGGRYTEAQCVGLAAELFVEHYEVMKGQPRVVWSTGLREALDIETALDWYEQSQERTEPEILFDLEPQVGWKMVRGDGKTTDDLRGELLTELASGDYHRLRAWFARMKIPVILYPLRDGGRSGIAERLNPSPEI